MRRSHRNAVVNNQLRTLFEKGKLNTTTPKAKFVKSQAESLVSSIKKSEDGDLNLRRKLQVVLGKDSLIKKAMEYGKKEESTVTFVKVGFRDGDNAELSRVELRGFKGKAAKKGTKATDVKEPKVEKKDVRSDIKKGIEKMGQKSIKKKVGGTTKERARTRSGL